MSDELSAGLINWICRKVKSVSNFFLDHGKANSKDKTIINNTIIIIPPKE